MNVTHIHTCACLWEGLQPWLRPVPTKVNSLKLMLDLP